jgi:multidrug transporter EmrE-like cation transporter
MEEEVKVEEKTETKNSKFKAKSLSKISMIVAGLWIMVMTILKGFKKIDLSVNEIIWSGIAVAAVWSPTYFSVLMDKIKDIKVAQ